MVEGIAGLKPPGIRHLFPTSSLEAALTTLYLAGPMTGLPHYNFPAFAEAAARLRDSGFTVISPAEHDEDMGWVIVDRDSFGGILSASKRDEGAFDWGTALTWDLEAIDQADGIYLLPGWSKSRGATKEYEHAYNTSKLLLGAWHEATARTIKHQPLVGLVGYAQAGKDTFAGHLGYTRLAFADPLKQLALACSPTFDVTHDLTNWRLGAIVCDYGWEYAKAEVPGVREFLQNLGVGVRDILGSDTWVQAAFAKYDPTLPTVFTDVRFPNEVEAIRERGGKIVKVVREGHRPPNGHVSEQMVDWIDADYQVSAAEGDLGGLAAWARACDAYLRGAA